MIQSWLIAFRGPSFRVTVYANRDPSGENCTVPTERSFRRSRGLQTGGICGGAGKQKQGSSKHNEAEYTSRVSRSMCQQFDMFETMRYVCVFLSMAATLTAAARIDSNVIYGMYSGLALVMEVYYPEKPNGYGVVFISGSGWHAPQEYSAEPLSKGAQGKLYAPRLQPQDIRSFRYLTAPRRVSAIPQPWKTLSAPCAT